MSVHEPVPAGHGDEERHCRGRSDQDGPGAGAPEADDGALERGEQERSDLAEVVGTPAGRAARLALLIGLVILLGISQGISMLVVVAAIVVMIFLHELGHYLMARRAGMLVTEFFIGFGPRIWSFTRGETEYGIKVIPAGAYVKIIGMSNLEEVEPELESRTYRQKSFSQRVGVAVAGSAMHFLIALVLLTIQFAFIGGPDGDRWQIGSVTPGSAADRAGLVEGDEMIDFDGRRVQTFDDFREAVNGIEPGRVDIAVMRDGEQVVVPVALSTRLKVIGTIGEDVDIVDNGERLVAGIPYSDGVAEAAGLTEDATVVELNGQPVESLDDVRAAVAASNDGEFTLGTVESSGEVSTHPIDLGTDVATTTPGAFLGVGQAPVLVKQPLPRAAWNATSTFGSVAKLSVVGVGKFLWPPNIVSFMGDVLSPDDGSTAASEPTPAEATPSGVSETRPISIVGVAIIGSDLSQAGLSNLVLFLAQLNIFIGVFNLFPLLPFDGGHVVIACYEKAQEMRRRSTQRYLSDVSRMMPIAYGVVIFLGVVGLLAIFMDLTQGVKL